MSTCWSMICAKSSLRLLDHVRYSSGVWVQVQTALNRPSSIAAKTKPCPCSISQPLQLHTDKAKLQSSGTEQKGLRFTFKAALDSGGGIIYQRAFQAVKNYTACQVQHERMGLYLTQAMITINVTLHGGAGAVRMRRRYVVLTVKTSSIGMSSGAIAPWISQFRAAHVWER